MRVATWNVNSVKQRIPRLLPWLDERTPDVVCLQETKLSDEVFDTVLGPEFTERGYEFAHVGQGQWNGVAILSRVGLDDVRRGVDGVPGYPDPSSAPEARAVSAVCGARAGLPPVRIHSLYVPNGREPDSDHYHYKLAWLARLREVVAPEAASTMLCGDLNIAPADADLYDPRAFVGHTHVTAPERAALAGLEDLGLTDVVRSRWPDERVYSYWDYRAGMFHKDLGMRIDLILAGAQTSGRVAAAWVDRAARKGTKPSDHAPVIVDLDVAPDGDIGPMVPPPSNPARRGAAKVPLPQAKDR
ncbi:MAG: exodeoxyribonuclease III [Gordonia sp. (in: high G+C Gram-positive bacteria)]